MRTSTLLILIALIGALASHAARAAGWNGPGGVIGVQTPPTDDMAIPATPAEGLALFRSWFATPVAYQTTADRSMEWDTSKTRDAERLARIRAAGGDVRVIERDGQQLVLGAEETVIVSASGSSQKRVRAHLTENPGQDWAAEYLLISTPRRFALISVVSGGGDVTDFRDTSAAVHAETLAAGGMPEIFQRDFEVFLPAAQIAIDLLSAADDIALSVAGSHFTLESSAMGIGVTLDAAAGELVALRYGSAPIGWVAEHRFSEFRPEPMFPARHPGVITTWITQYRDGTKGEQRAGDVLIFTDARRIEPPDEAVFAPETYLKLPAEWLRARGKGSGGGME